MALLTVLDIVNTACARIGEEPVESLTEDLNGGQSASLLYEEVVDFNLGLQPSGFAFAREVRQLTRLTDAVPLTGFQFVFDIPRPYTGLPVFLSDDIRRPDRVFDDFILTNGQVHSDADPLFAMVKFRPDPHHWTATFRTATITALAGRLAFAIASDRNTMDSFYQEAYGSVSDNFRGGQMRAAIFEDGFANPPRRMATYRNPLERAWRS
ncbi:hypothetical protein [Ochrobactrum sp. A-1]|uniref:hypothetical protein n=1 Tax=Ochrobactrum sp. A-1 TaxID=2920940 RepID=UPI001F0A07B5|nr:hypothetical protein [Ochrobactrum sp. A-1]